MSAFIGPTSPFIPSSVDVIHKRLITVTKNIYICTRLVGIGCFTIIPNSLNTLYATDRIITNSNNLGIFIQLDLLNIYHIPLNIITRPNEIHLQYLLFGV